MDFSLSPEQEMMLDSVEKFVQKRYSFENRRMFADSDLAYSKENWQLFAELGWLGIPFEEAYGGYGGDAVDVMIMLEVFGGALVTEPYIPNIILCGRLLESVGNTQQKEHYLAELITGKLQLGLAHTEPSAGNCLSFVSCRAEQEGTDFIVTGNKIMVLNGHQAEKLIVSVRSRENVRDVQGIELLLIDTKLPGVMITPFHTIDGLRAANVELDGVRVSADLSMGDPKSNFEAIEAVTDEAILAAGAEAVGGMNALCGITVDYARERKQFGVPISSFQVLQHRMVDMLMAYEESRSLLYMASLTSREGRIAAKRAASALKVKVGKAGIMVAEQAIQIHGGMGTTDELNVGYYYKKMLMIDQLFGNRDYHLDRFSELDEQVLDISSSELN